MAAVSIEHEAVLPVVVCGVKPEDDSERPSSVRFRSVYSAPQGAAPCQRLSVLEALSGDLSGVIDDAGQKFLIREGVLNLSPDSVQPWVLIDEERRAGLLQVRGSQHLRLGQMGMIRVGIKTHADPVFIRSDWSDLPEEQRPEPDLLRPVITHQCIEPWAASPGEAQMLYPYEDRGGRAALVDFDAYPRAMFYLEQHRALLERRTYVTAAHRQWLEIWVPHRPSLWPLPKVVFPDIAEKPRFATDRSGALVNGDCYWVVIEDDDVAEVVTAVGNSGFCLWFYDSVCGNYLYARRRRFMTQYMEKLPIPGPIPALADEIRSLRAAGESGQVETLIWSAFNLKEPADRQAASTKS